MTLPALLSGKRIAILGAASGLGLAMVRAAESAGAEVHGIDHTRSFDGVTAFYQTDLTEPDALQAVAQALPKGLDGAAFLPALRDRTLRDMLLQGLLAPRLLAQELAPRMAQGASIVLRRSPSIGTNACQRRARRWRCALTRWMPSSRAGGCIWTPRAYRKPLAGR